MEENELTLFEALTIFTAAVVVGFVGLYYFVKILWRFL